MILLALMVGLVSYSPTLYKIFCAVTGFGGTVQRVAIQKEAEPDVEMPFLKFHFDSNIAANLDWEFRPEKRTVSARIGEPTKIYYYAKNNTDETIVARAVYNVTPYKVAPYFFKIECFCFTEERLGPGEEARMPLVFYVDRQFMKDKNVTDVKDVTLSYTFYRQKDLDEEEVKAARDLKGESKNQDASLDEEQSADFNNDARRK